MNEFRVIGGVDEAGRGPVIGPLVVAGIAVRGDKLKFLIRIGVRDSKKLSPKQRLEIFRKIISIVDCWAYRVVEPSEIDRAVMRKRRGHGLLNELEARIMAEVICELKPEVVYVDAPSGSEAKFEKLISRYISRGVEVEVIARHRADEVYPVVSAASIIAKVKRDAIIEELKKEWGDFGSGYPSDPKTIEFLRRYYAEHGEFPSIVRRSWKTLDKIKLNALQRRLDGGKL